MHHWKYRAIDKSQKITTGVIMGLDEISTVAALYRRFIDLGMSKPEAILLDEIDAEEYLKEVRTQNILDKYRRRIGKIISGPTSATAPKVEYAREAERPEPKAVYPPKVGSVLHGRHRIFKRLLLISSLLLFTWFVIQAYTHLSQSHERRLQSTESRR